jgi:bifunctional N-acetylglucosamine-1-phosphate-uridyltransferase/glucosamine-1-phosphate-acetyltransferase GlmU-like protein
VAVVVAAAGFGTRIADEVGGFEMKHRVFLGDEMILLSLRNVIPFSRRIVAVVSERNRPDVQALLERSEMTADRGFRVDYVVQRDRMGDGDAHLAAQEVLADFPGIVVFVFADAPTKSPETIEKMILLKQALGPDVPLIVPCFLQDNPYSPIILSERGVDMGRVIWNWQKADEEDYPEASAARYVRGRHECLCSAPALQERAVHSNGQVQTLAATNGGLARGGK